MSKIRIRHLIARRNRDGSSRWYWQPSAELRAAGWQTRRLARNAPPHRAEMAAIEEAQDINKQVDDWRADTDTARPDDAARPPAGSLAALISAYRASEEFTDLAPKTAKDYSRYLEMLIFWAGRRQVASFTPKQVKDLWRGLKDDKPVAAHMLITVARLVFEYGRREDWLDTNPAVKLKLKRHRKRRQEGDLWSRADVDIFVATADAMGWHSQGSAVLLDEWLGQRQSDIRGLPRPSAAGDFVFNQNKTGATAVLPTEAVPHLTRRVAAEIAGQEARGVVTIPGTPLLLCETTGQPWKEDHFRHVFAAIRAVAALRAARKAFRDARHAGDGWTAARDAARAEQERFLTRKFMLLRHTAVTRLAEAGCANAEIAAITRHSLKAVETILEIYLVRTRKMAAGAFAKRVEQERNST